MDRHQARRLERNAMWRPSNRLERTRRSNRARREARERARIRLPLLALSATLAPGGALLCWVAAMALAAGPATWAPVPFAVAVASLFTMGAACVVAALISAWSARP